MSSSLVTMENSTPLLGAIADDYTGATDLANTLVSGGMKTNLIVGFGEDSRVYDHSEMQNVDAVIIALKTRSVSAADAIEQSLRALAWLKKLNCRHFFFKYCSTFDSTPAGNIGPVCDAMLDYLDEKMTVVAPAFPDNARTVYQGNLFVGESLLNESSMKNHPLTPMTDSNVLRLMRGQTTRDVALVSHEVVSRGVEVTSEKLDALEAQGVSYAVMDSINNDDAANVGLASSGRRLLTGSSSAALGLPKLYTREGLLPEANLASELPEVEGDSVVLSGSCSLATNQQVENWLKSRPGIKVDPLELSADFGGVIRRVLEWAKPRLSAQPVLIYATSSPEAVKESQAQLGVHEAGDLVERALAAIAIELRDAGVRKFIVAGGETSGFVVKSLQISALRVGPMIDPGVPWTASIDQPAIALALKSGNFGAPDFFEKALEMIK